jgi:hypothetical protein
MSDTDNPMYTATLTEGQTYVFGGKTFTFGVAVLIDAAMYQNLKRNARKHVRQGDGQTVRRVEVAMFKYSKATVVQKTTEDTGAAPEDDDDELDEVTVTVDADGNAVDPGEGGSDQPGGEQKVPPAQRSRARAATKA